MANIEIDLTPVVAVFPFTGVVNTPNSIQPVARIYFTLNSVAIAAKIATNTQYIQIDCPCPENFAYSLDYCHLFLSITSQAQGSATGVDNYDNQGLLRVRENWTDAQNYVPFNSSGTTPNNNTTAAKIWSVGREGLTQFMVFNQRQELPIYRVRIQDPEASDATGAGTIQFELAVYQYRLEQAFNIALNSPQPVISR